MNTKNLKIGIIGGGVMGEALIRQFVQSKKFIASNIVVSNPHSTRLRALKRRYGVGTTTHNQEAVARAHVVLLAVKPQQAHEMCASIQPAVHNQLFISIMAGVPLAVLQKKLHTKHIVRAMPNTPARIGQAMTVWYAPRAVHTGERALVRTLFSTLGEILETHTEDFIDKATAVSGSGPAYVFYFAECLMEAAQALGIDKRSADALVKQTLIGASALLNASLDTPMVLRKRVTSQGGTTEAAFKVIESSAMQAVWRKALNVAYLRARELSKATSQGGMLE